MEKFYETIVYFIIHTHFGYTLNYNDYLDQTNMGPDFFSNIELRNTYQSENNFVSNIRNFSGLNVLSLNIQSLPSKFEELKIFLDKIEKSGGNVSVLVLQEIWDVSIPNWFFIKDFELSTNKR